MTDVVPEYTQVNGRRLAYRLSGKAGAPVIAFSNSLMATMAMWDDVLPLLGEGWRFLRYDHRGHGGSEVGAAPFGIADMAADFLGLLATLSIEKVHFVGLSMGGMVGLHLASANADRVQTLTVCDCGNTLTPAARAGWTQRLNDVAQTGVEAVADSTVVRWFTPAFIVERPDTIEWVRAMLLETSASGYIGCGMAIQAVDLVAATAAIHVPTLILNGRQDTAWPPETALALQRQIAGAKLTFIDDAAHIPCIERPEIFAEQLSRFLVQGAR